ncbi:LOW QUALITY PROTEIN: hypothetical protein MSG28_006626 [Choristoneura fumiferana]|uniref:Uncharacterized protein n=1 Tax=Choristoneura fumiferana TaxID=7141 RepID=A0ACC0JFL4_CHOFU|nr:LOW QUALITY PROTEIN: hypothetical protein MSG28_006626 [Choristoneura fumiferana]
MQVGERHTCANNASLLILVRFAGRGSASGGSLDSRRGRGARALTRAANEHTRPRRAAPPLSARPDWPGAVSRLISVISAIRYRHPQPAQCRAASRGHQRWCSVVQQQQQPPAAAAAAAAASSSDVAGAAMRSKDRLAELLQRAEAAGAVYQDTVLAVDEGGAGGAPPHMEDMLQEAEAAVRWSSELTGLTATMRRLHAHPAFHTSPEMQEQLDSLVTQAHALGLKAAGALRQLEQRAGGAGVGAGPARAPRGCRRRAAGAGSRPRSSSTTPRSATCAPRAAACSPTSSRSVSNTNSNTNSEITEEECERLLDDNRLQLFVDNVSAAAADIPVHASYSARRHTRTCLIQCPPTYPYMPHTVPANIPEHTSYSAHRHTRTCLIQCPPTYPYMTHTVPADIPVHASYSARRHTRACLIQCPPTYPYMPHTVPADIPVHASYSARQHSRTCLIQCPPTYPYIPHTVPADIPIAAETLEARRGLRDAEARRAELARVEAALQDQEQIDSVEYFALQATEHVESGGHELLRGNVFRKKTKQKKISLIVCVSVAVFIILLVLIYT